MTLGEKILAGRKQLGWTQGEMARQTGLSKTFLCQLERGRRRVSADTLLTIARVLGVSLDALMSEAPTSEPSSGTVALPAHLVRLGLEQDIPVRHLLALQGVWHAIAAHRRQMADSDWLRLYEAIKEWL